ncbi:hypothetical protein [Anaerotignum sp.]|uniref:hypothetical protein n=1 Tax=Anaerotignum sp. TaxID=2039241 RepID=UPI002714E243|nr:hypothetical protein [Anaerotignum sp.]
MYVSNEERRETVLPFYNPMNKNSNQKPNKKKHAVTDIILMCLGLFILIRTPWSNMNSFYYLLFFLYIFCIMMRLTNIRKQHAKKIEMEQKKAEAEIKALEEKTDDAPSSNKEDVKGDPSVTPQENTDSPKDLQP